MCLYEGDLSTKSILQKINSVVYHDPVVSEVLSTLTLILVDSISAQVSYSGAGDLPLLYYNHLQGETRRVQSAGLLLGLRNDGDYDEYLLKMNDGDQLFAITDGITDFETANRKRSDYFSFERGIAQFLGKPDTFTAIKTSDYLAQKSREQIDDCSLIFLQKAD